jgi:hypothetical protein
MALADTAQLLVKLTLKDEMTPNASKATGSLKDLGKMALAVGGAAGFGLLTKGAMEAEEAQGNFMAATGKSRDEAKKFVSDMNDLAGSAGAVGVSFEEIADTGTMVEQQFGTTGDATRDLTDDILGFAKVTGQDASDAAALLEDTLTAYGLSAEDASGFMDQLVASNQKFGTEAGPQALGILQGMAPALQAMGMEIGDGVELLNAFEVAGLDAGTAQRGLQTAIDELEPGQNLDDLIARIGAIEDPTLRAQEAIEIFGTRAGAGLAQVIKPGMTSLDDFAVSAEDAAGATDLAAESMLTTADKLRGLLDKLGAGARDIGQMFGPLITGAASLGTLLGPALAKSFGVLKSSAIVKAASAAVGTFTGAAQAAAHEVAATGVGAIKSLAGKIAAMSIPLAGAGTTVGTAVGGAMSAGMGAAMLIGIPLLAGLITYEIGKGIRDTGLPNQLYDFIFGEGADMRAKVSFYTGQIDRYLAEGLTLPEAKAAAQRHLMDSFGPEMTQKVVVQAEATGAAAAQATGDGFIQTLPQLGPFPIPAGMAQWVDRFGGVGTQAGQELTTNFAGQIARGGRDVEAEAWALGKNVASNLSQAVRSSKDNVAAAMDDLMWAIKHPMAATRRAAEIEGLLMGDNLGKALQSKNPFIRQVAMQTQAQLVDQWQQITGRAWTGGGNAGNAYTDNFGNQMDDAAAIAQRIKARILAILSGPYNINTRIGINNKIRGNIPGMHRGGYIPPGGVAIVGERGPEFATGGRKGKTITPMGGAQPIVVNAHVVLSNREVNQQQSHYRALNPAKGF